MSTNAPEPATSAPATTISDALTRLWAKFLPETERRVEVLAAASLAIQSGNLSDDACRGAQAEAHKLAGTLGTFGLHRGTELARQAEHLFEQGTVQANATETRNSLAQWIAELRELIENRR
jgi:HPt (histidine-containing phosphotransfer) domain-containing protein